MCQCGLGSLDVTLNSITSFFNPIAPLQWAWNNTPSLNALEAKVDNALYGPIYEWYQKNSPNSAYVGDLDIKKAAVPPPPAPISRNDMMAWNPETLDTMRSSQLNAHWSNFRKDPIVAGSAPPESDSIGSNVYLWAGLGILGALILTGRR